ncbi:MAG: hypothetical protein IRZ16_00480 [Myxococcaceae bacterium]|nr:hypothetical protein [Myxococcaceae bacterium]
MARFDRCGVGADSAWRGRDVSETGGPLTAIGAGFGGGLGTSFKTTLGAPRKIESSIKTSLDDDCDRGESNHRRELEEAEVQVARARPGAGRRPHRTHRDPERADGHQRALTRTQRKLTPQSDVGSRKKPRATSAASFSMRSPKT